ncbi:uncharacterized protein LOC107622256 isoform X2 [Arachis ipaensis]|uniref:uncharacterized protein LOC107622256 isoform X2 n=2 Tax=Arachis ipaensis TaxID=130454 RepID=UPI000A2B181A|nr:uncharacterized protein LOC107622256 isoform X2 [Arachis ipaensis]
MANSKAFFFSAFLFSFFLSIRVFARELFNEKKIQAYNVEDNELKGSRRSSSWPVDYNLNLNDIRMKFQKDYNYPTNYDSGGDIPILPMLGRVIPFPKKPKQPPQQQEPNQNQNSNPKATPPYYKEEPRWIDPTDPPYRDKGSYPSKYRDSKYTLFFHLVQQKLLETKSSHYYYTPLFGYHQNDLQWNHHVSPKIRKDHYFTNFLGYQPSGFEEMDTNPNQALKNCAEPELYR